MPCTLLSPVRPSEFDALYLALAGKALGVVAEEDLDLGVLKHTFLHYVAGTQVVLADNQIDLLGQGCQIRGLLACGITAAYHCNHFLAEEESVTGGAGAHTASGIFLLILQTQILGRCTRRYDDGVCLQLPATVCRHRW